MSKPWLRLYSRLLLDAKVQNLSANLFRAWINSLCIAADFSDDGRLPPLEQYAYRLHVRVQTAEKFLQQLHSSRLVDKDENGWRIHDWSDWQYTSDVSTARVKRFRNARETLDETLHHGYMKRFTSESVSVSSSSESSGNGKSKVTVTPKQNWRDEKFAEFWAVVWNRVGKGEARRSFERKAKSREDAERIIAAARAQGPAIVAHAEQHQHSVLHPATWLNQGRYDDEGVVIRAPQEDLFQ